MHKALKTFILLIPLLILSNGICLSQIFDFKEIESKLVEKKWTSSDSLINTIDTDKLTLDDSNYLKYLKSQLLIGNGKYDLAFSALQPLRTYYTEINNKILLANVEGKMIECISYLNNQIIDKEVLIESFCQIASELNDYQLLSDCYFYKGSESFEDGEINDGIYYYKKISKIAIENNDSIKYHNNQLNVGMLVGYYEESPDQAIKILQECINYFKKIDDYERHFLSRINLSIQNESKGDFDLAVRNLLEAEKIPIQEDTLANKQYLFEKLSSSYEKLENYSESLNYIKKSNSYKDSLDLKNQLDQITELQTKYQTAQKEKENLILTADKKRNQNIAIGLGGSLALGSIIAILVYRNTKRKQRIAEQEKELEIQRTEKVLKEKEIETINAMIEGQEKERQRLAGDLHDSIGGTLAAIKMHIGTMQNVTDKKELQKDLLTKADTLISDAYTRVRKIAHERNSGVMAKDGLLPAIQRLAKNVTNNNLEVLVQDFGLDKRLNNELEITIFRIVQELVTNIIKHAQATEATISLTQHDEELNIMVEDNGKGFKVGKLEEKNGMGLGSIERRVEHLEGSIEVDSTIGKGTHIIIDIPL